MTLLGCAAAPLSLTTASSNRQRLVPEPGGLSDRILLAWPSLRSSLPIDSDRVTWCTSTEAKNLLFNALSSMSEPEKRPAPGGDDDDDAPLKKLKVRALDTILCFPSGCRDD